MRLIDANALILDFCDNPSYSATMFSKIRNRINNAPTIDAVPVKRGTWKLNKDGSGTCDQCHFTQNAVWDFDGWQNFCGVCGADMRERKDGDG